MKLIFAFIIMLCMPVTLLAQEQAQDRNKGESTGLPLPRFASLNADQVFARMGPGTRFPIQWAYQRKNLPIEIVDEFDNWRKIRDIDGEGGWVHQSLLSGKRYAFQNQGQALPLYRSADDTDRQVAVVETMAMMAIESCNDGWCRVTASGIRGWIEKEVLWGVYEGERIQ